MQNPTPEPLAKHIAVPILLVSVCIIAICGILYELLISTISSYFLGSSVLHFSLTIGLFLSFMGFGAYISKYLQDEDLLQRFVQIEIWLGFIGGASGSILYASYALTENYYIFAFFLTAIIGSLVGLEIPILARIIKHYFDLKDTLAQVLSFDYLGALIASVIFPLFLLPYLGFLRTSFFIGLLNLSVGVFNIWLFREQLWLWQRQLILVAMGGVVYVTGFIYSFGISAYFEQFLYQDEIILTEQSPYQRIVVTQWKDDIRLYLNGNLQFCSIDEYRYHESLVQVPMAVVPKIQNVLILGGGDGLATRETLKKKGIKQIDIVDLDKAMTDLGKQHHLFKKLNKNAFDNPIVKVYNQDAYQYLEKTRDFYDLIIIDLPDPDDVNLAKLYTQEFYQLVKRHLSAYGVMVTQSSSPFFAREAFWCIHHTLKKVFPSVIPYNANVPSFGQWGFNMASVQMLKPTEIPTFVQQKLFDKPQESENYRFLNRETVPTLFIFDEDMKEIPTAINQLNTQKIVQYYEKGWKKWNE